MAICARGVDGLKAAAAGLRKHGGAVFAAACDVGNGAAQADFVTTAADTLGGIDVLINKASGIGMPDDDIGGLARVNVGLLATVRATRATVPTMEKSGGGAIVNISSISGTMAVPRSLPFAAIKAAIINYTMVRHWRSLQSTHACASNGHGRCATYGLRAHGRCTNRPTGHSEP